MPYKVKVKKFKLGNDAKSFHHSVGINLEYSVVLRYYRSLFNNSVKYKVLCHQTFGTCFQLWKGTEQSEGEAAYSAVKATLQPLMEKGVLLTTSLLEELILPNTGPVGPDNISSTLTAYTGRHNDHPEWTNVVKGLQGNINNGTAVCGTRHQQALLVNGNGRHNGTTITPYNDEADEELEEKSIFGKLVGKFEALTLGIPSMFHPGQCEDEKQADKVWKSLTEGKLDEVFPQGDNAPTWLIDAIENDQEKTAIHMILSRFDTNKQSDTTGDTPLHIAIRKGNEKLVKLLLAYQADPTIINNNEKTPIDEAKTNGNREILDILSTMQRLRQNVKEYYSRNNQPVVKENSSDLFLLCLDGGGMKAVITCHILAAIQTRMKELDEDIECMTECFEYMAGTSAGAILGALLMYNSITCVWNSGMYLYKFMHEVFMSDKELRQEKLKGFITDVIGERTVLSDVREGRNMIVTATIANVSPSKLHLMTNYNSEKERPVWESLLASSAAPYYFPPFENKFLDGGLMANNPTLPAIAEVCRKEEHKKIGFVLSIGTGLLPEKQKDEVSEVFISGLNPSMFKSLYKSTKGLVSLLDHFMEQTTRSDGEVVIQARYWCKSVGAQYERLSPMLEEKVASDMSSIDELVDLLYETETYILKVHEKIDRVARLLVQK